MDARAKVRGIANAIASEIHPLNNLRVLKYLKDPLNVDDDQKQAWYHHWIHVGFTAIEKLLESTQSFYGFCCGETPTIADFCLVPQVYNAIRFECPLGDFPRISAIYKHCLTQPYFDKAKPENQVDAPEVVE